MFVVIVVAGGVETGALTEALNINIKMYIN